MSSVPVPMQQEALGLLADLRVGVIDSLWSESLELSARRKNLTAHTLVYDYLMVLQEYHADRVADDIDRGLCIVRVGGVRPVSPSPSEDNIPTCNGR